MIYSIPAFGDLFLESAHDWRQVIHTTASTSSSSTFSFLTTEPQMVKIHFLEILLVEGHFIFWRLNIMTSTDSNIKILPPFLEGIAKCFDLAGFFDDFILPAPQDGNPVMKDWQAVCSDYNNSIKIINEELNAEKKSKNKSFNFPKSFSSFGLLPSPEMLQKYDSVLPGLADRLVLQAEKQTIHRIALEKNSLYLISGNLIWVWSLAFLSAPLASAVDSISLSLALMLSVLFSLPQLSFPWLCPLSMEASIRRIFRKGIVKIRISNTCF